MPLHILVQTSKIKLEEQKVVVSYRKAKASVHKD